MWTEDERLVVDNFRKRKVFLITVSAILLIKGLGRTKKFRDLHIFNPKELLCKFEGEL